MTMRAICAVAALAATPALAEGWTVDSAASTFGFASIKNGDIAETHEFGALSGGVAADGSAEIAISLASVETRVDIRDERMRDVLFDVATFPLAHVRAQVDVKGYADMSVGGRSAAETEVAVEANGVEARYDAILNVTRVAEDLVSVSAAEPIMVDARDFGYGAGIERLRDLAGLDSISTVVPITFDIMLTR